MVSISGTEGSSDGERENSRNRVMVKGRIRGLE